MNRPNTIPMTVAEPAARRRGVASPLGDRVENLLPPFEAWQMRRNTDEAASLPVPVAGEASVFASPCFKAERDVHYAFELTFAVAGTGGVTIGFRDKWNRWCELFENPKSVVGEGQFRLIVPLRVPHDTKVSLAVVSREPLAELEI